jgi:hypothetical protein
MSSIKFKQVNSHRRHLLLGGLAVGATGLLQACGGGGASEDTSVAAENSTTAGSAAGGQFAATTTAVTTPAPIPANQVNLADFGGVPGASSGAIINAFNQAFAKLKSLGGGTLNVGAGKYSLGSYSSAANAIAVSDLKNVLISAYGAQLTMTTTAVVMPVFIHFENPRNVTVTGLSFYDYGTNLTVNWQGAICISINTSVTCVGFKTVDCLAENVVTFLRTYGNYTLTGMDIHGTVRNSYYALNPNNNGSFSKCNIACDRVRRALVSHGAQNWDFKFTCTNVVGGPGSNGFIDLVPSSYPVKDCTVDLTMTGDSSPYGSMINFYHQGSESAPQYMRNVKAKVIVNNATGKAPLFRFMMETSGTVHASTIRTWEQLTLTGSVTGTYAGPPILNTSTSTGTTNLVNVAANLATLQNATSRPMSSLPSYFKVFTPTQCSA